ncbi:glycerol-3-phosphate dehydrogenase/oxidase [Aliagarivorans marinus]|uniref:glycerol-3-phosphate dehydrogenase/oxidase n=1 Tax=Aliagarivorans marinus TaxID=561965 RepID=UPI00040B1644|nr:glycerol-3-phosphate dehydrogenase/oxidase [Aliagarivorans marinus]
MRRASLSSIEQVVFDVVVVGGGITGSAIARDAALRGMKVLLVEKEDFGSGTSSRSSKLIHGGLRYLETYQFGLVAESVRERELALRLAPHLTKVQPFLYMFYKGCPDKKWLLNLGMTFYDVVSGSWSKRRHQMLNKQQVLARQPGFRADGLRGAAMFYDVSTDDARLTIDTTKSAWEHSAQVLNHCKVTGLTYSENRCDGVQLTDLLSQTQATVKAHYVVNATGPWSDQLLSMEKPESAILRPTKGVHIVLRKQDFPLHSAVFMRSPDDGRVVWPIPSTQDDRVFIGTTDTTFDGDPDRVVPEESDISYLLNVANHLMPSAKLDKQHVIGSWAGLRPLIAPAGDLSNGQTPREHQIMTSDSGVYSIVGGKLTSNRVMAKQVLDKLVKSDNYTYLSPSLQAYSADKVVLSGGAKDADTHFDKHQPYQQNRVVGEIESLGVPYRYAKSWVARYGHNARIVAAIWNESVDYQSDLGARALTIAELRYCVLHEAASSLKDLLVRRTSAFFWDSKGGLDKIGQIAQEMQNLLGWSEERKLSEIDDYFDLVCAHRACPIEKPTLEVKQESTTA